MIGSKNLRFDQWSVGMIILEILAGTEIAMMVTGIERLTDIFDMYERYLDKGTL